jgi:REP element-mobilizing transposase RayT
VGSIVRGVKIGITKWYRNNTEIQNIWQRNYYDHIIRNEDSYFQISKYIQSNPVRWQEDKYNA